MRHRWMLYTGIALVVVGLVGMAAAYLLAGRTWYANAPAGGATLPRGRGAQRLAPAPGVAQPGSVGESVYLYGVGGSGPVSYTGGPVWFGRMGGGCAVCHGVDGRGGPTAGMMMGRALDVPDIRYSTLADPHPPESGSETATPGWTDEEIATVIREGVEPDGEAVSAVMPQWDIGDDDMRALIEYLKELDAR